MTTPICRIAQETGEVPLECLFGCDRGCGQPAPGGLITIIAGSREGPTAQDVAEAVEHCGWRPSVVVSGGARGGDRAGELWAARHGVPTVIHKAAWQLPDGTIDRGAGHKRNVKMAERSEALIALWDGQSPGTRHMIQAALARRLRVYVWKPRSAR